MKRHTLRVRFSFGLTSGVITTLRLMMGLYSGTHSRLAVIAGILTIALADSLSDATGIYLSEESENVHSKREIWESTLFTFVFKALFTSTFIFPILFLEISVALVVSVVWGLFLVSLFSYKLAKERGENPLYVIGEHVIVTLVVVIITHYIGTIINLYLG